MDLTNNDPVLALLDAAPIDDEPVTDDDRQHIAEAWEAYRAGHMVTAKEIRQSLLGAESDERCSERRSSLDDL